MFTIKAQFTDTVEIRTDAARVREFFLEMRNFVELMPGIESIHFDRAGNAHWKIRADIPVIGSLTERFSISKTEDTDEVIEWGPTPGQTGNLLRFSAEITERSEGITLVRFGQSVELRRRSGKELHALAPLAGESAISREMGRRVADMIRIFVAKAKENLERQR